MARKPKPEQTETNGDSEPKPVESKAERFRRLANRRLFKAEKALAAIANLGNRSQYEYTDEQANIISSVIVKSYERIVAAFTKTSAKTPEEAAYV